MLLFSQGFQEVLFRCQSVLACVFFSRGIHRPETLFRSSAHRVLVCSTWWSHPAPYVIMCIWSRLKLQVDCDCSAFSSVAVKPIIFFALSLLTQVKP